MTERRVLTRRSFGLLAAVAATVVVGRPLRADVPATQPASVDRLVEQLSDADPDVRYRATEGVQELPPTDLPALEAAAARTDLPPEAEARLRRVMPAVRQRAKLVQRKRASNHALAPCYERMALADYDGGLHTNPKWDDAARAFLRAASRRLDDSDPGQWGQVTEARRLVKVVLDAGCDDPTVLALAGLVTDDGGGATEQVQALFARSAAIAAAHPDRGAPLFRMITAGRLLKSAAGLDFNARRKAWPQVSAAGQDLYRQGRRLIDSADVPSSFLVEMIGLGYDRLEQLGIPRQPFIDYLLTPLEAKLPNNPGVLGLKGRVYVGYAWEARGIGLANTVTRQGWADMAARLAVARAALEQAWHLDPDDPGPPTTMLSVELGQGTGRPTMELWFNRAMAADPDNYAACHAKLYYLEPKWYGSPDDMVAFGRQCVAGDNWFGRLPTILADAHVALSGYSANPTAYWLQPGVWDDIVATYVEHLRLHPDDAGLRGYYAKFAFKCHQWKVLNDQFKLLGDQADPALFGNGSPAALDEARRTAARLADKPDEQGK